MESTPEGLDSVADLRLIGEALMQEGSASDEVEAIHGGNWLRVLNESLQ